MKTAKIIALFTFSLITLHSSPAQDFTYSTNLFYAISYPTNWYLGTNGTDRAGDNFQVIANKLNHDVNWLWTEDLNRSNGIAAANAGLLTASNIVATVHATSTYQTNVTLVSALTLTIWFTPAQADTNYIVTAPNDLAGASVSARSITNFTLNFTAATFTSQFIEGAVIHH